MNLYIFKYYKYKRAVIAGGVVLALVAVCCMLYYLLSLFNYSPSMEIDMNADNEPLPVLNLTNNPVWDDPVLDDTQYEDLYTLISQSPDSIYGSLSASLDSTYITTEQADSVSRIIDNMPQSPFKGTMQIDCLNNLMFSIPQNELTPEKIHDFLEKGYKIASGASPIPQSGFYVYWNNCIIQYSNNQCTDSVSKEALRFIRICRRQNLPIGIMFAYVALGYCLMDALDYQGASENFDRAMDLAEQHIPLLQGKDWYKQDVFETSDYVNSYLLLLGLNARCHIEARDTTWIKDNEANLINILHSSTTFTNKQDIYYSLALYYDKWGYKKKYEDIMTKLTAEMEKEGYFSNTDDNLNSSTFVITYNTLLLRHELRNKHGDKAMAIIDKYQDYFVDSTSSYLPDALLLQCKYKDAALLYKKTVDHYYGMLNGRNRYLLQSLSASILEENKQIELRLAELESQRRYKIYNAILVIVLTIMICGLGFFLYKQRKLNKNLNEALAKAERASYVRDIFLKNMRHEVNTPLNAVFGFAQLLADRDMPLDDDTTHEMADGILEGSEHLMKLLDNIFEATERLSKLDRLEDAQSILDEMEQD